MAAPTPPRISTSLTDTTGCAVWLALVWSSPAILVWSLPLTLGYLLAIPFAMATASPRLGLAIARRGICATPEELSAARPAAEAR